jgi:predicted small secreted protein
VTAALVPFAVIAIAAALAACGTIPRPTPDVHATGSATAAIYLVRRGWHVDLGFAARDLMPQLAGIGANLPGARFIIFGFGDRRYLLAKHKGLDGLFAVLRPGPGLILASGLRTRLESAFGAENVIAIPVTAPQANAAQSFVRRSLSDAAPNARPYAMGPYEGSVYFEAVARYSASHTCNTWAAEGLQSAGLPIRSRGTVFAGQLWRQARRLEQSPAAVIGRVGAFRPSIRPQS